MKKLRYLVACAFSALIQVSATTAASALEASSSDFLSKGISLYQKKDYAAAQEYLSRAVAGEHRNVAVAHYYLANSLMQLNKTNAALEEYQHCYNLAPFSSFSGYCRMMLLRYGRTPDAKSESKAASASTADKTASTPQKAAYESGAASQEKLANEAEVKQLKARLPRLVAIVKETPLALDVMADSIQFRSAFIGEAEQRKTRAFERLEQSRQTLKRAESVTHSFVPSVKSFGETDEEFRSRRARAEETVTSLLEPFRENVNEAEKAFQTESSLLDNCINARNGFQ
ncbi:MAG TPA: hypothetical protein PKZ32_04025 [Candidatus Melainabacteria bacterium]|nr:hypothetical protein [Candidatus Melainabacteria bacterium]